jgi:hypothetical protein
MLMFLPGSWDDISIAAYNSKTFALCPYLLLVNRATIHSPSFLELRAFDHERVFDLHYHFNNNCAGFLKFVPFVYRAD